MESRNPRCFNIRKEILFSEYTTNGPDFSFSYLLDFRSRFVSIFEFFKVQFYFLSVKAMSENNAICRVDLNRLKIEKAPIDPKLARAYLGGRGLAGRLISDMIDPTIDAFSPKNPFIVMTGPLTGTISPFSGRHTIACKSPLTKTLADSSSGGFFGATLKRTGFNGIIVTGKASKPRYLLINNGHAELRDASHLWGKNVEETEQLLKKECDPQARVLTIGPAGENLVKYASVMNEVHRAAGRCGLGAVLGSKKLKAIVAIGDQEVEVCDPEKLQDIADKINAKSRKTLNGNGTSSSALDQLVRDLKKYGTALAVNSANEMGDLPTRYHETTYFEDADMIGGEALLQNHLVRRKSCYNCNIACGRVTRAKWNGTKIQTEGPEFETLVALGSVCSNSNLDSIIVANHLCNLYGLDTISAGQSIAFAFYAAEKGALNGKHKFGDAQSVVELVQKIAFREGIGDLLAEGVAEFSKKLGLEEYAVTVKGMEPPAFDPRTLSGQGLAYMVSSRGADHRRACTAQIESFGIPMSLNRFNPRGKATLVANLENMNAVVDSAILCGIGMFFYLDVEKQPTVPEGILSRMLEWAPGLVFRMSGFDLITDSINAATGFNYSNKDLRAVASRIITTERLFNIQAGYTKTDDDLPLRWKREPISSGPAEGVQWNESAGKRMLSKYYKIRGWDSDGIPKKAVTI
jgi:aldehyde:ferredoxin oxidoreductase